jgi:hypothetical protein
MHAHLVWDTYQILFLFKYIIIKINIYKVYNG